MTTPRYGNSTLRRGSGFTPKPYAQNGDLSVVRKARYNAEAEQARTFEDWLLLHRWYFWHVNLPQRSKAGFPDYMLLRERIVFVELKARSPATGRIGKLSLEQTAFHEMIRAAGGEVHTFWLPDDWQLVHDALKHPTIQVTVPS